ncbi:glycosyl hydrolase [Alternaria alternata]|nr:glycosyl hydrolase [Alternaria alternata]
MLKIPEGPKMFFRHPYHYLLIAEGGTVEFHRASIARSTAPKGPWLPAQKNPLTYNGGYGVKNLTVQSTGHADFVEGLHGEWYASFLARRQINGSSPLGRETFLTTVQWQNIWPVLNGGHPIILDGDERRWYAEYRTQPTLFCRAFQQHFPPFKVVPTRYSICRNFRA